jgi:hypothetical protein
MSYNPNRFHSKRPVSPRRWTAYAEIRFLQPFYLEQTPGSVQFGLAGNTTEPHLAVGCSPETTLQPLGFRLFGGRAWRKRSEIAASLRNRDDIAIEKSADAIDEVQLAAERELAIRNLDRESSLLRDVEAALARTSTIANPVVPVISLITC